jgi:hypothetical protein
MLDVLCTGRAQINTETGPAQGGIIVRTNAAAMSFDNRLTDGQTHAHSGVFGREEAIEKKREMLRINTWAAVLEVPSLGWLELKVA